MAKMFPKSIEEYNATKSEKNLFYALKQQLDDSIYVFFSVSWMIIENGVREMSEVDFLIFDPKYGYLTIEVKGGQSIKVVDGEWYVVDDNYERKLKKSPFDQSEKNMWYFKKYYQEQFNFPFQGTHGYMVAYPNFSITNPEYLSNRPREVVIDYLDMNKLSEKIKNAFIFWQGKDYRGKRHITDDQREKFIKLVHKRIALSASAGSLIEDKNRQLELINRVQDNYIRFLENYHQVMIKGGAGTGKTWIAIKYAQKAALESKSTLICCYSAQLKKMFQEQLKDTNCRVSTVDDLISEYEDSSTHTDHGISKWITKVNKDNIECFDTIIIDEAQDFNENDALFVRMHLKDQERSDLYVFYDDTQNLFKSNFGEEFLIDNLPFLLKENLRNTASIYEWATHNTKLGLDVITNPIVGPKPESRNFSAVNEIHNAIESTLNELILQEGVDNSYITIVVDDGFEEFLQYKKIGIWNLISEQNVSDKEIRLFKTSEFKGLESNVVIYVKEKSTDPVFDYVAYTRAKFYLYEYILQ